MSGSVNKVILVGRVGKDPEVRRTQNGDKIVNLSVATSESWKDKSTGERKEKTEWNRVSIFDERLADIADKYVKKGSQIYLEGQLQTRKWQAQDGTDRYSTEVVLGRYKGVLTLLDSPRGGGGETEPTGEKYGPGSSYGAGMDEEPF